VFWYLSAFPAFSFDLFGRDVCAPGTACVEHPQTCFNSIANLRKRGRHVQVGLMLADHAAPAIPMAQVIANELEIVGSHGMQAHRYGAMLEMILAGKLSPQRLVGRRVNLEESITVLTAMDRFEGIGVTVVDRL
jgi:alcohol dehydrogenase